MANGSSADADSILLVEGQDDLHVVRHMWHSSSETLTFCIREKQSVEGLLRGIRGEIVAEDRTAVGIVADANDNIDARWRAVTDRLRDAGINPPDTPTFGGTIIDSNPRVGVWLMPDNQTPGELEDFIAAMIPSDDAVWPLSESYIEGIPVVL